MAGMAEFIQKLSDTAALIFIAFPSSCTPRRDLRLTVPRGPARQHLRDGSSARRPHKAPHDSFPARQHPICRHLATAPRKPARRPPARGTEFGSSRLGRSLSSGGGNRTKSGKNLDFRRKTPILRHKMFAGLRCRSVRKHTRTKR